MVRSRTRRVKIPSPDDRSLQFFAFAAGFFRESGATESSTRLVGILSFLAAIVLSFYAIVALDISASDIAVIAMNFTYGCVALGLRKAPEDAPHTTPPASPSLP